MIETFNLKKILLLVIIKLLRRINIIVLLNYNFAARVQFREGNQSIPEVGEYLPM